MYNYFNFFLLIDHKEDVLEDAVTGKYVLRWTESDDVDNPKRHRKSLSKNQGKGPFTCYVRVFLAFF